MLPPCHSKGVASFTAIIFAVMLTPTLAWPQSPERSIQTPDNLKVLLLDSLSQPVEGAKIGFSASFGDNSYESPSWVFLPDPASLERFPLEVLSDERGIAILKGGKIIVSKFRCSLVARHEGRQLAGIANLARSGNEDVKITLYPECKVTGKLECPELEENGIELERNWLNVSLGGRLCVEYYSLALDFHFFLPPGRYSLTASGANGSTLRAERTLVIPEGVAEMKLYPMQLSLKGWEKLAGLPAPDLTGVIAWKGDGPKSLQDLRGEGVLLDFWGYWCPACIARIPRLIELDNRYRDGGLRILGLHIDAGERISSLSDYDAYAKSLKAGILEGKDITYPVALIAEKPTPFGGKSAKDATCEVAAAYGVNNYPTMILIDRNGNVVGEFHDTPEGLAILEKLLGIPGAADNPKR